MPKSKHDKVVTLSKTKKKGRKHKEGIVNSIREATDSYNSVYVFAYENMRNIKFKEFREQLKSTSRFFLGSNKVMKISLGHSGFGVSGKQTGMYMDADFLLGGMKTGAPPWEFVS